MSDCGNTALRAIESDIHVKKDMVMRRALPLIALFLVLGPHIPQSKNFTPIPVARNCRPTDACLRNCEAQGGQDCYVTCDRCK